MSYNYQILGSVKIPGTGSIIKALQSLDYSIEVDEYMASEITVPASTTDLTLPLSLLNPAQTILLVVDGDLDVKINGGSTAITINPMLLLAGSEVTGITVTNSDTEEDVTLTMIAGA